MSKRACSISTERKRIFQSGAAAARGDPALGEEGTAVSGISGKAKKHCAWSADPKAESQLPGGSRHRIEREAGQCPRKLIDEI